MTPHPLSRPSTIETVGDMLWREVQRLEADIEEVRAAMTYDGHRPEMQTARKALYKLGTRASRMGDKLNDCTPLPEPE